ncbi:hypothetical protein HT585_13290 [Ensifer sp. HO-A22]|uniref:Uncharacterized protein n=1 Tax=Ensifer oleiphilus TaxID=2742698 RepID=A0A7Y6Q6G4_9HYPH|nr:hypothetical protein [Ensifer oleiphilus]NVD39836.1 hypothetical protein [Ensifer oleiphilus]
MAGREQKLYCPGMSLRAERCETGIDHLSKRTCRRRSPDAFCFALRFRGEIWEDGNQDQQRIEEDAKDTRF